MKNTFIALSGWKEKESINREDIKKFIFRDSKIEEKVFDEYLEEFGMKKDDKISFEQFCNMIRNDKKLNGEDNKEEDNKDNTIEQIINKKDEKKRKN